MIGDPETIKHGTVGAYTNRRCRCAECRRCWTRYNRRTRERRKARGVCIQCKEPRDGKHVRCRAHHAAIPKRGKEADAQPA